MFCPNCGSKVNDNSRFCRECGYKIEDDKDVSFGEVRPDDYFDDAMSEGKRRLEAERERRRQAAIERENSFPQDQRYSNIGTGARVNKLKRKAKIQGWIILLSLIIILVGGYAVIHIVTKGITFEEYKEESRSKFIDNMYTAFGGYGHGLSCKSIYMSYKEAMEEAAPALAEEYKAESEGKSDKEQIAQEKLAKLAIIEEEGRAKMNYMASEWAWQDIYDYDPWSRRLYMSLKDQAVIVYTPFVEDVKNGNADISVEITNYNEASVKNMLSKMLDEEYGEPKALKDKIVAKEVSDEQKRKREEEAKPPEPDPESIYRSMPDEKDPSTPYMAGTSIKEVMMMADLLGLSEKLDEQNWGYGITTKYLSDEKGGISISVEYFADTEEILCAQILTNNRISKEEQVNIVKSMSGAMCPPEDAAKVITWVEQRVGRNAKTQIGEFTYEVSLGPDDNVIYHAGYAEWDEWADPRRNY